VNREEAVGVSSAALYFTQHTGLEYLHVCQA